MDARPRFTTSFCSPIRSWLNPFWMNIFGCLRRTQTKSSAAELIIFLGATDRGRHARAFFAQIRHADRPSTILFVCCKRRNSSHSRDTKRVAPIWWQWLRITKPAVRFPKRMSANSMDCQNCLFQRKWFARAGRRLRPFLFPPSLLADSVCKA